MLVGFGDGHLRCENGERKPQCLLKTTGKEQGWTETGGDVASPGTGPFRSLTMGLYRCWDQPVCWKKPYLVQLLSVISHKSPGAEIRNEEAFCAEIA